MSLSALLDVAVTDNAELSVTIPLEWLQGRTAYGGLSAAIALATAKTAYADLPPLRSAQIAFVGPLSGPVTATPSLLRRGKNSAFVSCDVAGDDGVGLRALFLFMASRTSMITHIDLSPPDFPLGDERVDAAKVPQGFLTNFELSTWQAEGGSVRRWVRLCDRNHLPPDVELVTIADALPPAAMTLAKEWGPISTTTWQLNLVTDAPESPNGWWLLEAKTLYSGNGNSSQTMTVWNCDGVAQATATQSVALFI
jgi:Thioesterase-like superfamily